MAVHVRIVYTLIFTRIQTA